MAQTQKTLRNALHVELSMPALHSFEPALEGFSRTAPIPRVEMRNGTLLELLGLPVTAANFENYAFGEQMRAVVLYRTLSVQQAGEALPAADTKLLAQEIGLTKDAVQSWLDSVKDAPQGTSTIDSIAEQVFQIAARAQDCASSAASTRLNRISRAMSAPLVDLAVALSDMGSINLLRAHFTRHLNDNPDAHEFQKLLRRYEPETQRALTRLGLTFQEVLETVAAHTKRLIERTVRKDITRKEQALETQWQPLDSAWFPETRFLYGIANTLEGLKKPTRKNDATPS